MSSGLVDDRHDTRDGPEAVLRRAAERTRGRLLDHPIEPDGTFRPMGDLTDADTLLEWLHRLGQTVLLERLGQSCAVDDPALVGAAFFKELLQLVTNFTIQTWGRERRVLDVSLDNLVIDISQPRFRVGLRRPVVAAIDGNDIDGDDIDGDDIDGALLLPDEPALLDLVDEWLLDDTCTRLIGGFRNAVRVGQRHLWGNVAHIASSAFTHMSHDLGTRADDDADIFFGRHPELLAHLQLVAVSDGQSGEITFSIRRNCCLRIKLPDVAICINCNLVDRDDAIRMCTAYHVAERSSGPADGAATILKILQDRAL